MQKNLKGDDRHQSLFANAMFHSIDEALSYNRLIRNAK
jgi:hypothetical protein